MYNRYVIGDIHGGCLALDQLLQDCNFDFEHDTLFPIGDVCDGWSQSCEVIRLLLKIKNLIPIMGNHDVWLENWLRYGDTPNEWIDQGGDATVESYKGQGQKIKFDHLNKYFAKANYYYIDDDNNLFVHGGFKEGVREDRIEDLMWDRKLWKSAMSAKNTQLNKTKKYNKVFIGHTAVDGLLPLKKGGNVWNLDTGAGYDGRLTIMNIDTEEYHQSYLLSTYYPEEFKIRTLVDKMKRNKHLIF